MGHLVISMIMTSVMHTLDGCLYVECVWMCVHVPRHSEHPRVLSSPDSNLCACTPRDWWFEAFIDVKILGAGDDLLSSAAGKSRYAQLTQEVALRIAALAHLQEKGPTWSHVPWTAGQSLFCFFSVRTCSTICPFRV